ncbi:MAG: winged helix-turn-helix domain-containing protein [Pseudomonadota bacterium]
MIENHSRSIDEAQSKSHGARRTDPSSSHEAIERFSASGKRSQQAQDVYLALWRRRPAELSSLALADASGLDRFAIARRLPELERTEPPLVRRCGVRHCAITGGNTMHWTATV